MNPRPKNKPHRIKGAGLRNLFQFVLERDNYTCQNPNCKSGFPLDPAHHVIFKSQGGPDTPENLITLCVQCHDMVHKRKLFISGIYGYLVFSPMRIKSYQHVQS